MDQVHVNALAKYFTSREWHLHECNAGFENKLDDDVHALLNPGGLGSNEVTEQTIDQLHHIDISIGNTFRYVMFAGVCTFLDELLTAFAKLAISDFEAKFKRLEGNDISKLTTMLSKECGVVFEPQLLQRMLDLWIVRRCVVHFWGDVNSFPEPVELRAAVARLSPGSSLFIGYIGDKLLFDDHGAVPLALTTAMDVKDLLVAHFS